MYWFTFDARQEDLKEIPAGAYIHNNSALIVRQRMLKSYSYFERMLKSGRISEVSSYCFRLAAVPVTYTRSHMEAFTVLVTTRPVKVYSLLTEWIYMGKEINS